MDDDEIIRQLFVDRLKDEGFIIKTASDGKEAVEIYKQAIQDKEPFSVVIMYLTIRGGVGGREAVKDILSINPQAKVIVSSGYADDPVLADYRKYGFKGRITKPYTKSRLMEVLEQVLEG